MSILVRRRVTVRAVAVVRLVDQAVRQTAELLRQALFAPRRVLVLRQFRHPQVQGRHGLQRGFAPPGRGSLEGSQPPDAAIVSVSSTSTRSSQTTRPSTDMVRSKAAGAVASDGAAVIGGRKLPPVRRKKTFYAERPDVPLRLPARPPGVATRASRSRACS
jgi:hypothetical protein